MDIPNSRVSIDLYNVDYLYSLPFVKMLMYFTILLYKSFIVIHIFHRGDNNSNGGCSYGEVRVGNNCTGKKKTTSIPYKIILTVKKKIILWKI